MANSLSHVRDSERLEDYDTETRFTRGKREYFVERVGDRVSHHETQSDDAGKTIYDQGVEVQYAVGSGKRGRSYIIDHQGILFLSPISWYSQAGRWDLSPGYPDEGHQRFERRVTERCVLCHAGRAAPDGEWVDRFEQPAIVEFAIGCENCHGPGAGHIAHQMAAVPIAGDDPIVNPKRLKPAERDSVCNQCHLQGNAEILRYGRTNFDFRPGMHVGEVWSILLTHSSVHDEQSTKAVSQVQQMLASACARASGGRLGCISCHDPHSVPSESEKAGFYREKCLACHGSSDCRETLERRHAPLIEDSCVACHMPRLNASDVPHTAQTDHEILRRPRVANRENLRSRQAEPAENMIYMAELPMTPLERSRPEGIRLAKMAELTHNRRLAQKSAHLLEPVLQGAPDDRSAADGLAVAWCLTGRTDSAIELWRRQVEIRPIQEEMLFSLAVALENQGATSTALEFLDRLLRENPWQAHLWRLQFRLLSTAGRNDEGWTSGRKALDLDPSTIDFYFELAQFCRVTGNIGEANRLENIAKRLKTSLVGPAQAVGQPHKQILLDR